METTEDESRKDKYKAGKKFAPRKHGDHAKIQCCVLVICKRIRPCRVRIFLKGVRMINNIAIGSVMIMPVGETIMDKQYKKRDQ